MSGDLIQYSSPAPFTELLSTTYFNRIGILMDSLGSRTEFKVDVAENKKIEYPDRLTFAILTRNDTPLVATGDPLGTHALFSVGITGTPGGELSVYPPAVLGGVGPSGADSILVDLAGAVWLSPPGGESGAFARIDSVWSNLTPTSVGARYYLPAPSPEGRVEVLGANGHLVRTIVPYALPAGSQSVRWDLMDDRGTSVAAGSYLLRIRVRNGRYLIQKLVVRR